MPPLTITSSRPHTRVWHPIYPARGQPSTQNQQNSQPQELTVSYSMLNHLGTHALGHVQSLFDESLFSGRLPTCWKEANIRPIPKLPSPNAYRPISLLPCLSITMEHAVLTRLRHLVAQPHNHTYAYCKELGTKDNLAAIHSTLDGNDGIILFPDLGKTSILASKGSLKNSIPWIKAKPWKDQSPTMQAIPP